MIAPTSSDSRPAPDAAVGASSLAEGSTRRLACWIAELDNAAVSASAFEWATHATLDWLAVTVAAVSEPLVRMLDEEYGAASSDRVSPLCDATRGGAWAAALINGAAGHALDFDDVSARMHGHPSAPVLPAALAVAQLLPVSGRDFLRAVVVGHEVQARIGEVLGGSHYARGFHATGTLGTFGAAAAVAALLGLDETRTAHALGLAATQAAGLKSMFGTMAKPLHAGKAAMNGLMAARLAARGFTANMDAIECFQGFAWTQADEVVALRPIDTREGFAVEQTLFKYHASCYLTHSTIEAVRELRPHLSLDDMQSLEIAVPPGHLSVCDIAEPDTGLCMKFSIRHLAVLALDGADTAALDLYTDRMAGQPRYVQARARVRVTPTDLAHKHAAGVTLRTRDGRTLAAQANVGIAATDPAAQWRRLTQKARAIAAPVLGESRFERLHAQVAALAHAPSVASLMEIFQ
ncbi:MAG: MmgE/PrpD family protein [Burkholderiaceae bacterium]|jgi:2-methylcitrate dehydratase PrpD|nr:MmgE/PrpD family protein [Burkholderiaceae bacterium]